MNEMDNRAWNCGGPPPKPGIYNAVTEGVCDPEVRREWNGYEWSCPWLHGDPQRIEDRARANRGETQHGIAWREVPELPRFRILDPLPLSILDPSVVEPLPLVREEPPFTLKSSKPSNPKDSIGVRKAPMSTVSAAVLAELGVAMLEGAAKYGRHNYRAVGVRASVYYDALMRHAFAWFEGEDIDPDSGMSHITKAIATLVVLRDAMIQGKLEDDRAPRSAEFFTRLNLQASNILDRHADKSPKHYTIADEVGA
jgi:hypothetical protein